MRIAMLLSGGVDSSVALHLLHDAGHDVHAFYLKIWLEDELAHLGECPWEDDLRYAREVCERLGVPLEIVPLQREYHQRVVAEAVEELRAGHTPSPDILCNRRVKFGVFHDHLEELAAKLGGFDKIASGHYARVTEEGGRFHLWKGVDPGKDQTYFLCRLDQERLGRCLFPLGGLTKAEVRRLAEELDFPNRDRPDSQGICFLGDLRYDDFVEAYLGEQPGEIRDAASGEVLGEHRGLWFHTIGQRRGLGLGGGPWYVVGKRLAENLLEVAHGEALEKHRRDRISVDSLAWIGAPPTAEQRTGLSVKVRHSPSVVGCRWLGARPEGEVDILLEAPDAGLAAGQQLVFYAGAECLGGGRIVS